MLLVPVSRESVPVLGAVRGARALIPLETLMQREQLVEAINQPLVPKLPGFELVYEHRDVALELVLGADSSFEAIHQRVVKMLRLFELLKELFGYLLLN
jgi:hypothetical protein